MNTANNAVALMDGGQGATMTSMEMVEFINSLHEECEAMLTHSDFLKEVPKVLGETVAQKFLDYYKTANGKYLYYRFPKREAYLMAVNYNSHSLLVKVFDRMDELEQQANPIINPASLSRLQLIKMARQAEQELLVLVEENAQVVAQLAIAAPKAAIFDRISNPEMMICLHSASKLFH